MKNLEFKQKLTLIITAIFLVTLIATIILRIYGIDTSDIFNIMAWVEGGMLGFYAGKSAVDTIGQETTKRAVELAKESYEGSDM